MMMLCPRCESTNLTEKDREGVTIDVCPRCRGLWLDRGELEKLIARARHDDEDDDRYGRDDRYERDDRDRDGRDRDDRYERSRDGRPARSFDPEDHFDDDRHRGAPRRKRRWYESFGDIFD